MMEERGESMDPVLKLTTCRFAAKWIAPRPFLTAACKPNNFAESTLANTASRSMSVQERGCARVYAYSCPRATQQQCRPCQQKEPERERKRNAGRSFSISLNSRKGCCRACTRCGLGIGHFRSHDGSRVARARQRNTSNAKSTFRLSHAPLLLVPLILPFSPPPAFVVSQSDPGHI